MTVARRKLRSRMHEHAGSLRDVVDSLSSSLTTASIMTPWSDVQSVEAPGNGAEGKAKAFALMEEHQYSAIPVVWSGSVVGVYIRHEPIKPPRYEGIRIEHFINADLGLLDLIRGMRDTQKIAVGVGHAESPKGWLTYADFSKRPFRVLLFAVMAEVEYLLAQALDLAHPDDSWIELLARRSHDGRDERAELLRRKQEAEHWDVTMPVTTFAEIGHLIDAIGASEKVLSMLGEAPEVAKRLRSIPDLRNRVAHVVKPVVAGPKQIAAVASQIDLMLEWIDRWSKRLAHSSTGESCHE